MITFPLSLPTVALVSSIRQRPIAAVAVASSPFTLTEQVQAHQGDRWVMDLGFMPNTRAEAEEISAFMLKLNGREGTFLLGVSTATLPRGTPTGAPVVAGGSQSGKVLNIDGMTASSTGNYLVGDYIQLGSGVLTRLYKILDASVDADGAGAATIDIWPRLRESPADNEPIISTNSRGTFRLGNNEMSWDISLPAFYEHAFTAIEATK